jgi:ubiquinone/menaquinone biosynthesis C-methylase UbiE
MNGAQGHFDDLAVVYNSYKARNSYYSLGLEELVIRLAGGEGRGAVLDLGCGTGRLLRRMNPSSGLGIDISDGMIRMAREGAPSSLKFLKADACSFRPEIIFDLVVCCDVLEHIHDREKLVFSISRFPGRPRVIMTWPNPRWFTLMRLLEMLRLKMPEGSLYSITLEQVSSLAKAYGMTIEEMGYRMLIPTGLLGLGDLVNDIHRSGFLRSWGLIQYLVMEKRR